MGTEFTDHSAQARRDYEIHKEAKRAGRRPATEGEITNITGTERHLGLDRPAKIHDNFRFPYSLL